MMSDVECVTIFQNATSFISFFYHERNYAKCKNISAFKYSDSHDSEIPMCQICRKIHLFYATNWFDVKKNLKSHIFCHDDDTESKWETATANTQNSTKILIWNNKGFTLWRTKKKSVKLGDAFRKGS